MAKFTAEQLAELNKKTQEIKDAIASTGLEINDLIDELRTLRQEDDLTLFDSIEELAAQTGLEMTEFTEQVAANSSLDLFELFEQLVDQRLLDQSDLNDQRLEQFGLSLSEKLELATRATKNAIKKQSKKTRAVVREEAERTRAAIRETADGGGLLCRPWNWLAGAVTGFIAWFISIFIFKIGQFSMTDHSTKLNLLNYTTDAYGVKTPMCDPNVAFFSRDFWFSGEGYFWGMSKNTNDQTAVLYLIVTLIALTIGIATALIVAYAIRRRHHH